MSDTAKKLTKSIKALEAKSDKSAHDLNELHNLKVKLKAVEHAR